MIKLINSTKCTVTQSEIWSNKSMNQTHLLPPNWSVNTFKWLRIRNLKSWKSKKKFNRLSRINRLQLMIRNSKLWRKQFRPRWTTIRYCWTIKPLCSRKCILKLISWSTETNKLSKTRKKLPLWSTKLISIFLRLSRKLPLFKSFKKSSKWGKPNTKIWRNKSENWKDNVTNLRQSSDKRKKN